MIETVGRWQRACACTLLFGVVALGGCSSSNDAKTGSANEQCDQKPRPAPELGSGDHSPGSVDFVEIVTRDNGLKTPRDLAFNPRVPDELWIVNYGDDSMVIVHDTSTDERWSERRKDGYALHFMPKPASIAFGADETTFGIPGTFATCGESRNTYDDTQPHNDFMGPALWSSDLSIFARRNPIGLGSHIDMLHNSPLCMGVAHEKDNVYWTFDGLTNSISRYDFQKDHDIGMDDHSDGLSFRYVTGQVQYVEGVPSHLAYDPKTGYVYVADTGHKRIARLDPSTATEGPALPVQEPQEKHVRMDGATLEDVVSEGLEAPSGLRLRNDLLYVTDNATGRISAYTLDGELVNYLDTGLEPRALAGLAFGPDDRLYFVDMLNHRVLRVDPR